jgi:SAM-dependent methyltransferase
VDFIPFYLPRIKSYAITMTPINESLHELSMQVRPFDEESFGYERTCVVFKLIMDRLVKFMRNDASGRYVKLRLHDRLVPKSIFQDRYCQLKPRYSHWVSKWNEAERQTDGNGSSIRRSHMTTDPLKHVFEDILIATFLICLWEAEYGGSLSARRSLRFIDIGCGNGFLVHLLSEEGFTGYGVDLAKRPLWDAFPSTKTHLIERTLDPTDLVFNPATGDPLSANHSDINEVNANDDGRDLWLIGNHADELTGWIPLIAARTSLRFPSVLHHSTASAAPRCKFMVLPCCFHDLAGQRNPFGRTITWNGPGKQPAKYEIYLQWVRDIIGDVCGYQAEDEWLRIPSTKNACIIGRRFNSNENLEDAVIADRIDRVISSVAFVPRLSDREKNALRELRKRGVVADRLNVNDGRLSSKESSLSTEELLVFADLEL